MPIHRYCTIKPWPSTVRIYVCHRGVKFQGKSNGDNNLSDRMRQYFTANYVRCKFYVKVIYLDEEGRDIVFHMNTEHHGHESGSMTDCYFLPVHQSTISVCYEMLKNLNNIQLALAYSKRCQNILHKSVPLYE